MKNNSKITVLFTFLSILILLSLNIFLVKNIDKNKTIKKQEIKKIITPKEKFINIFAGGDIMLSRNVGYFNNKDGIDRIFKDFNPITSLSGGIAIFNLESPFSKKDNDKYIVTGTFRSNINNSLLLKEIVGKNIGVFSIANNHIFNGGKEGFKLTKETITKEKLNYIGDMEKDFFETILEGKKICVGGYSYDGDNKYYKKVDEKTILDDLEKMKKANCFFKIIMPHWGKEYTFNANNKQKELAHKLIDNGVDLIIGSHPHIFGEVEVYNKKYIFYSLGNYIFDQNWGKDGCDKNKDCIYDEKLKKETVPTYIGTLINLKVNIDTKEIILKETIKTRIDDGKISEY